MTRASGLAALSASYPDARSLRAEADLDYHAANLIAKTATVAGLVLRSARGQSAVAPDAGRTFAANFLVMLSSLPVERHKAHPAIERALNVLFILHADHELNCSTSVMRAIGSAGADPYAAAAGAAAALSGPAHGGANEAVLRALDEIGAVENVPAYVERAKRKEVRVPGIGHPIYRSYDPRARIIKRTAEEVFEVTGRNARVEMALELERIVLADDYFVSRRLHPNVDFYSGLIYESLGIPPDMMTVMFAVPRASGWAAHWREMRLGDDGRIVRPRQIYVGPDFREEAD